jgi:hypothetical protein
MKTLLKSFWNLPTSLLGLVVACFRSARPQVHKGCGGQWDDQARWGPMYERCKKCGSERRRK